MPPTTRESQRAELHKTIWRVANDLRGSVDGWDFKSYVLGMLSYRFISENLTAYLNRQERAAGDKAFNYEHLSDQDAEHGRAETVKEKGFFMLPSELFANGRAKTPNDDNLNETLSRVFQNIEASAAGADSEVDLTFEIELIKQVEITVDYILLLVQKYRDERGDGDDTEVRARISRAIDASPSLRNKKELIEAFVDRVSATGAVDEEWTAYVAARRDAELSQLIADESLHPEATREFIDRAFRDGALQTSGVAITRVLPPASRFAPDGAHAAKKQRVLDRLGEFFERYFGLG